jgi:hypothetical protein
VLGRDDAEYVIGHHLTRQLTLEALLGTPDDHARLIGAEAAG